ncbi:MAG: hypothetical protein ACPGJI_09765, partial [Kangiellaceae bacterium]
MALRLQTQFVDVDNIRWRVSIDDSSLSVDDPNPFVKSGDDGFALTYEGQNQERFNPVLPTKVTFSIELATAAHESLITDLANSAEGRFKVHIEKERKLLDVWFTWWVGTVVADQVSFPDMALPYFFQISAVDQISTLSKIDYKDTDGTVYEGDATLMDHVKLILGKTNASYFYAATDDFLLTTGEWYDTNHDYTSPDKTDPWLTTRVNHIAFYTEDEDGNKNFKNCFVVLQEIMKVMGAKFFQSDGLFRLEQINDRANSQHYEWTYQLDGTQSNEELTSYDKTLGHGADVELLANAVYSFLPGLKSIILNYSHFGDRNLIGGAIWDEVSSNNVIVGSISSNLTDTTLSMDANLYVQVISNTPIGQSTDYKWRFVWRLKIKYGTKYLKREITSLSSGVLDVAEPTWEDAVSYYEVSTEYLYIAQVLNIEVNFETPVLPLASGILEVDFDLHQTYRTHLTSGDPEEVYTPPPPGDLQLDYWGVQNPTLELYDDGTPASVSAIRKFQINNDNGTSNTEVLEVNTSLGDALTSVSKGKLEIFNSSSEWEDSTDWAINQTGTLRSIMELLLFEMMKGQKFSTKLLNATVKGPGVVAHTKLTRFGEEYIFMGGSFSAVRAEWSGEWFELKFDDTNLSFGTPISSGGSSTTGSGSSGTTSNGQSANFLPPVRQDFINHF